MKFWLWLRQLLLGKPPARDLSRLESRELDVVAEEIDVSGGPRKPGHRRRALRDPRLLPKAKAPVRLPAALRERQLLFGFAESKRLFSATLLTRNRSIRDLAPDEEQLQRLGLPVWRTDEDLAQALGITLRQLWFFGAHRDRELYPHYVTFAIPKRGGGRRLIMAPKKRLKAIQRQLLSLLVERLPVSENAHAFRKGRNIRSGADPHVGQRMVVRLDLKDFFPTVTWQRVRGLFLACGYGYPVATTLAMLVTEAERQPVDVDGTLYHVPVGPRHCVQGAPTSPALCNAIVLKMDHRLAGLARKFNAAYSRYADDLTFSGDLDRASAVGLLHHARKIIAAEGFTVNEAKTRLQGRGGRQVVTGVIVNQTLGLSRQERRRLRAALHRLKQQADPEQRRVLEGKLNYLAMLNPRQAAALRAD